MSIPTDSERFEALDPDECQLGADPTDDFADIFPGTGGVTVAWDAWCQRDRVDQGTLFDSETDTAGHGPGRE